MLKKIVISFLVFTVLIAAAYFAYWKTSEYIIIKSLEKFSSLETVEQFTEEKTQGTDEDPDSGTIDISHDDRAESPDKSNKPDTSDKYINNNLKKLSPEDREYVMGIYSRYSAGEISEVSGLVAGEMTSAKKKRIKEIVFSKMSRAEYNHLCELANKYGY